MVYRFQLSRSPRAVLLPLIALLLLIGSVAAIVLLSPVIGFIALVISGFVTYHFVRFFIYTLQSRIQVHDEGILCKTGTGAETRFLWESVTCAGWYETANGNRTFFVYAEADDELIALDDAFERLEDLAAEIGGHIDLMELRGEHAVDLSDVLKEKLFPDMDSDDDDTSDSDA